MITSDYADFFRNLSKNNNREWFHDHKKAYEKDVKEPFLNLIAELIPKLKGLEPSISDQPKDALFRINRDIRFSKDKTPYHTLMKAGFSPNGKKSFLPGYYLGISIDEVHLGGGLFMVQPPELIKIRQHIIDNSSEFLSIVNDDNFVSEVGKLRGEIAKRFDKSHMEASKTNRYIAHKQFYAMADLDINLFMDAKDQVEFILDYFQTIDPLNKFLKKAF